MKQLLFVFCLLTICSLAFSARTLKNQKKSSNFVCPSDGLFANPNFSKCNTFYNCGNGKATLQKCPWPLVFHSSVNGCDKPTDSDCIKPNVVCPSDGIQPNPAEQTSFFLCDHGVATLMQCADGLRYDKVLQTCNWANQVAFENLGCDQGWNAWTIFSTPYGSKVDCQARPWTFNKYRFDVTGASTFVYCWGTEPVLAYCCKKLHFDQNFGYCV